MENRLLREIHGEGGGRGVEERDEETGQPDENQNDSHNVCVQFFYIIPRCINFKSF